MKRQRLGLLSRTPRDFRGITAMFIDRLRVVRFTLPPTINRISYLRRLSSKISLFNVVPK